MKAVYAGSFDPVTYGHIDVIKRCVRFCDELVVAVLDNIEKKGLFTTEERLEMLKEATVDMPNVTVRSFQGMTVELCREEKASVLIRGLRDAGDYESERRLCQVNRVLNPEVETLLILTDVKYSMVSSSGAKEIASFGGDLSAFLPPFAAERVREKYKSTGRSTGKSTEKSTGQSTG